MFKKKDKEAERVRKEQKRIIKEAREEEKARERKAKEEAKQRKLKERNKALAKKEGWYEERRPDYNPSRMLEEAADIWSAARLGDLERMKQYISQGIGIGARDKDGLTALHFAAENGHIDCLQWILSLQKINVNVQDRWGMTPLHKACFAQKKEACEWLILRGADLTVMTEGGISPLEKAIEWGEEFAAALIAKASQVEANGIIVEDAAPEDLYGDEKVKWGDQVIYVDKKKADAFAKTEETLSKAPPPQEEEPTSAPEALSVAQQRGIAQIQDLAASHPMQEAMIRKQLDQVANDSSGDVIPELREATSQPAAAPPTNTSQTLSRTTSAYDFLLSTKRAQERATRYKDIPTDFARAFDQLTTSATRFVYYVTKPESDQEARSRSLNLALKDLVVNLKELFQVVHPFANTKFHPVHRGKIIKSATELQLAIQNIVQGVKNRNVAMDQFRVRAEERLYYFTQVLIGAVWNMHMAVEFTPNDIMEEGLHEYSSQFREILACALGKSTQSLSDVTCFTKYHCIQILMLVNAKLIEVYHSDIQLTFAEAAFTIWKGTNGLLMAAEKVKADIHSPHRETMTKLTKVLLFQVTRINETLGDPRIHDMYNMLDEATEQRLIVESCGQLEDAIRKQSNKERETQIEEMQMFDACRALLTHIRDILHYTQPDSFSCHDIIAATCELVECANQITIAAMSTLKEAASELLETYLVGCLRGMIYFTNQVKSVAASLSISTSVTTKMMLPLSIRAMTLSLLATIEAVDTCLTVFDQPFDDELEAEIASLPSSVSELEKRQQVQNDSFRELDGMSTIRSTRRQMAPGGTASLPAPTPMAQLDRPAPDPVKKKAVDMATIRRPRQLAEPAPDVSPQVNQRRPTDFSVMPSSPARDIDDDELSNLLSHTHSVSSEPSLDDLVALSSVQQRVEPQVPQPVDALDELEALANAGSSSHVPLDSNALAELDMLVNLDRAPVSTRIASPARENVFDELDDILGIASSPSPAQPPSRHLAPTPSNPPSFGGLAVDENEDDDLMSLVQMSSIQHTPSSQPPQQMQMAPNFAQDASGLDELDELDALVSLSSVGSTGYQEPPQHYQQYQPQQHNYSDELEAMDELEELVSMSSISQGLSNSSRDAPANFNQQSVMSSSQDLDLCEPSAAQGDDFDALAELEELANL